MWNRDEDPLNEEMAGVVSRFEKLSRTSRSYYFDVHEYEHLFDYYFEQEKYRKAEAILNVALSQHPNSTTLLAKKAQVLLESGDPDESLRIIESVQSFELNNESLFMTKGACLLLKNNMEEAMEAFEKAFALSEFDLETGLSISQTLSKIGEFSRALYFLKIVTKEYPDDGPSLWELAGLYEILGNNTLAEATYLKYLESDPFSESAWFNLGVLHNNEESFDKAIEAFDFTLAINPGFATALFNKANALANLGLHHEAIAVYKEYLVEDPDNGYALYYTGESLETVGESDEAFLYFKKATKTKPAIADPWFGMASIKLEQKDPYEALYFIGRAIGIDIEIAEFHYLQGLIYEELEFPEDATSSYKMALLKDPDHQEAKEHLDQINNSTKK